MDNPVRLLRENLRLNQHQFGDLIGRSYSSVQAYEAGKKVPTEIAERLKNIAVEKGFADIAATLTSGYLTIQEAHDRGKHVVNPAKQAQRSNSSAHGPDDRDTWHGILDLVWTSRQHEAIAAIKHVMLLAKVTVGGTSAAGRKKGETKPSEG